jgi:TatD DNase family protein
MGYYVGFDGNITYSESYSKLVISTPLDRLLLETDSPYLTPIPHRGTRNEPAFLPLVGQALAVYQNTPLSQIAQTASDNARKLFNF